jgi:4-hydroxybenzoate polyprenyltransferase
MPAIQAARIEHPPTAHSRLSAARTVVELFHFPPILIVLLACGIFASIAASGSPPIGRIVLYLLAVLCSQMAIGVHNDYCDRELDSAAKPWRAIPGGVISPALALELTAALLALSVALALPLGSDVVALGILGTGMGFIYNAWGKGTVWAWAPFWVALPTLAVASFAAVDAYQDELLLTYAIGLPLVAPVYIADTLIDIDSDRAHGVRSLATRLGPFGSRVLCWSSLALGYVLAVAYWPTEGTPGFLFGVSIALLATAILSDRIRVPRVHWLGIMLAVIALAADWLVDVASLPQ